jgi:HEPN domain-containing protein
VQKLSTIIKHDAMNKKLKDQIQYWKDGSKEAFAGAIAIEKLLKAFVVEETKQPASYTHDLRALADKAGIKVDSDRSLLLEEIYIFNIEGRYSERVEFSLTKLYEPGLS